MNKVSVNKIEDKTFTLMVMFVVSVFTFVIYYDSFFYGESNYDDHVYFDYLKTLFEHGLTISVFSSVFLDFVNSNWHPITVLSLSIDYLVGNGNPVYFHVTNSIIHVLNATLIYIVFYKLSDNKLASVVTVLLFTVHPLNVETVIWISERKGLLSTFFALSSLNFYINYKNNLCLHDKFFSVALFVLSLLSKPTTASIPFILILLDFTVFNYDRNITVKLVLLSIKDKTPFFIAVSVIVFFSFLAQSDTGALRDLAAVPINSRIETSINNVFIYISKIFIPINLALYYPHEEKKIYIIFLYFIFILTWLLFVFRYTAKSKIVTFCLFFFFIQIIPMSGLFQTGGHSIALRYTYLPSAGLFFVISVVFMRLRNRAALFPMLFIVALSLVTISINQTKVWKSHLSLWEHSAKNTGLSYYTAYYYAFLLVDEGRINDASKYFFDIIGIKNKHYSNEAVTDFAIKLMLHKHYIEAKLILEKAIKHGIKGVGVYRELAVLEYFYFDNKNIGLWYIKSILDDFPDSIKSNRVYAKMLLEQGNFDMALRVLNEIKGLESENASIDKDIQVVLDEINATKKK